jgi:hypothetical protein
MPFGRALVGIHGRLAALVLAALLAACASNVPAPSAPARPTVAAPLAAEERWLEQFFAGTPVVVGPAADGAVRVEVPLKYCFDQGGNAVKAPLAVVLDKVAASLSRQRLARLALAAPTPERSVSVRDAMVARGVRAYRIERLPPRADAVELRLVAPPAAIQRLDDSPSSAPPRRHG